MTTQRTLRGRVTLARLVTAIGGLFAFIEVVYILLQLFNANPGNGFYGFIRSLADPLALFFPGLFAISNHVVATLVNYGLPAVFWLVVSGFIARLLAA
ncbi:MAG TPA: hypothetical protein VG317_17955 [Pseudonocardiaceae bacterium]|jgi:hypothetical protein|nr:hypothetical protein [Pseudonocardiaceae bacterium]